MTNFPPWANKCQNELAYFLGLITGRGTIVISKKIIIVEFNYAKQLDSIPYCPECSGIMKGASIKKCAKHGEKEPKFTLGPFNQQKEIEKNLEKTIIPILEKITKKIPSISHAFTDVGGDTYLALSFQNEPEKFKWIVEQFSPHTTFSTFEIPKIINKLDNKLDRKIMEEFVSGITDTAGMPKWGNFHPGMLEDPKIDRARFQFEFVRNWKLPVQVCNFLQNKMGIMTQTMDWGHPNFRDPKYDLGSTSFGKKEHQLKIYAENFPIEFHKLNYKREILEELRKYNISKGFTENKSCKPPTSEILTKDGKTPHNGRIKVVHPGENDKSLPKEIVDEHFDRYWQTCWKLGCTLCDNISNKEDAYLTGKDEKSGNLKEIKTNLKKARVNLYEEQKKKNKKDKKFIEKAKKDAAAKKKVTGKKKPEEETYKPLKKWLEKKLQEDNPKEKIVAEIVATTTLSTLPIDEEIVILLEDLKIQPDLVGFAGSEMSVIESKISALNLENVGQIQAYCLIADSAHAYLISTRPISAELQKQLQAYPELLEWNGKKIQIGQLNLKTGEVKNVKRK